MFASAKVVRTYDDVIDVLVQEHIYCAVMMTEAINSTRVSMASQIVLIEIDIHFN